MKRSFLRLTRYRPRTLYAHLLLALLVGVVAVQALGFWLMINDRDNLRQGLMNAFAAQRIAGVISIFNTTDAADRPNLLKGLSVPPTRWSLQEPWQKPEADLDSEQTAWLMQRITQELDQPLTLQVLTIERAKRPLRRPPPEMPLPEPAQAERRSREFNRPPPLLRVKGQVRLDDGAVLTFQHSLHQLPMESPWRLALLLALVGVSSMAIAWWAVRRLTRPLQDLAHAATGLARDLSQPPLPETGPLEVANAAVAFNAMQRDLKQYLDTRHQTLAAISHDLRLPITRLRLRLERISDEALKTKMQADLSEMDTLIGHALSYLRAGAMDEPLVRVDVNALLESLAEDSTTQAIPIQVHGRLSQPVWAYPQALKRCLGNLLDNACRYGGGRVDLTVSETESSVQIGVVDHGAGIPEHLLEEVFEPYMRVENSRAAHTGGTGLGLAIARAIAKAHGGSLKLVRREGGGLSAILNLPKRQA